MRYTKGSFTLATFVILSWGITGKPCSRERLSTTDILVLTSLDQLIFKLKILFTFIAKQGTLMWKLTVLRLPRLAVFPGLNHQP
jgi:hypothetical protein